MSSAAEVAVRHAIERAWHERRGHHGQEEHANRYKRLVLEPIRARQFELLGDLTGKRVLEVGCGVGTESIELARRGASVLGVDLAPSLVEEARRRASALGETGHLEFAVRPAESLADDGEQFDVVWGNGVLHHLDLRLFKNALKSLLRPGGIAQFHEPVAHNPLLRLYRLLTPGIRTPTERPLSVTDLRTFVKGFGAVQLEFFNLVGLLLLPAPYLLGTKPARRLLTLTRSLDRRLLRRLPGLGGYCQYVVMQFGLQTDV